MSKVESETRLEAQLLRGVLCYIELILNTWKNIDVLSFSFQTQYDDGAETTRRQLLSCCMSLQIASDGTIDRLIDLWRGVVRRVYHYYQLSAKAYFTYLRLNGMVSSLITGQCCI